MSNRMWFIFLYGLFLVVLELTVIESYKIGAGMLIAFVIIASEKVKFTKESKS